MTGLRAFARSTLFAGAFAALLLGLGMRVEAMDIQPLRLVLEPQSGQSAATISVNNTRDRDLQFEVLIERRVIAEDGTQTFEPADDDFVVFPMQGSVAPGNSRAVRVQYVGPDEYAATQGYVVRVVEVPVQDEGFSGVQFAYAFGVATYVKPAGARDDLRVVSVERTADGVAIALENVGNDYALLTTKRLRLQVGDERRDYVRQELGEMLGLPLIAPQSRRLFTVPIADLPVDGPVSAIFDDLR